MPSGPRNTGDFCWINVLTPNPDEAQTFFGTLLGWQYVELPGMGHLIQVNGEDIGGMWDLHGPNTPKGTPPGIGVMIKVANADEVSEAALPLGGKSKPAFDVGPQGRMAEIWDPTGAQIDLWEGAGSPGMTADPTHHGVPSWIELITPDIDKAATFYRALFDWTSATMTNMGFRYVSFNNGDHPVAGMMAPTEAMGHDVPPHWGMYCTVDDVDLTAALVEELGGTLCVPTMDIPEIGRVCGITSPQGVMFYAITYLPRGAN